MTEHTHLERNGDRTMTLTRTIAGPVEIVYRAWTEPELLKRWWAPRSLGVTMYECRNDVRVGGSYRYVFGKSSAEKMAFTGVFREVVPNERIVMTQVFEPMPDAGEVVITTTFREEDGKTTVTSTSEWPSKEALEGALATGMDRGMKISFEQADELVASLSA